MSTPIPLLEKAMRIYKKLQTVQEIRGTTPERPNTKTVIGTEQLVYAVDMDFTALAALARKAANNKSQKSSVGPLTVHILSRTKNIAT